MPHLYIITGSNGAGKSTVGASYFPEYDGEIFEVVLLDAAGVVSYSGRLDVRRIMAIINKGKVDDEEKVLKGCWGSW